MKDRERVIMFKIPSSTLLKRKQDLSILIHIPEAAQSVSRMTLKATHSSKVHVPKRITSSTNNKWVSDS